ncbi:MAG: hypothetical protein H6983_00645 [Ectothiorhodospiraceae bacterium]|nr:hypothetical protein [Ectothiorhodospiraceae bacterium]
MASPVDPARVLMTGENSFIRLSEDGGKTQSERTSHWRVLWCPAGAGHALFMTGKLTGGKTRIYSDDAGVARWLQETIETLLYPDFADTSIPVTPAVFARQGDPRGTATELVESDSEVIRLTWWSCIDPFVMHVPASPEGRPIGVYSTFFPARQAQIALDERYGTGSVWMEKRGEKQSSSAVLAWSETWVKP